jgi:hypothetical protein
MKNGNLFGAVAIITLALTAPAEAGRKCYDDQGEPHSCNIIYGNNVGGYDGQPFVSHNPTKKKKRWWRERYPTHGYEDGYYEPRYRRHRHKNRDVAAGLAGIGLGIMLGRAFDEDYDRYRSRSRFEEERWGEDDFEEPQEEEVVWDGPFDDGGAVKPTKGSNGKIAHWYVLKDKKTLFYNECHQHGDEEGVVDCRGLVTGLTLKSEN